MRVNIEEQVQFITQVIAKGTTLSLGSKHHMREQGREQRDYESRRLSLRNGVRSKYEMGKCCEESKVHKLEAAS